MKFRNVKVPEGINVSPYKPLRDLLVLTLGAMLLVILFLVLLWFFGGALARYMPISWESALADKVIAADGLVDGDGDEQVRAALQALSDRISAHMALPAALEVTVHYVDSDVVNASATIGGHIFVSRGLIEKMASENALAMVIGHEIGHVVNRDAIAGVSGLLLSKLAFILMFGGAPEEIGAFLDTPNLLLLRGFSRRAERRADAAALRGVTALYGHVAGAAQVFDVFLEEYGPEDSAMEAFLHTHPLSADRIADIHATAMAQGWPVTGETTALAEPLAALARAADAKP